MKTHHGITRAIKLGNGGGHAERRPKIRHAGRRRAHNGLNMMAALAVLSLFAGSLAGAADIWWQDRDGTTGTQTSADWDDLDAAIDNAQNGSVGTGMVKISGNISRTSSEQGQLSVNQGGYVTISGGWTWNGGAEPVAQSGRSVLDAAWDEHGYSRVIGVYDSDVTLDALGITRGYSTWGGGVYVYGESHRVTMTNLHIYNNRSNENSGRTGAGLAVNGTVALEGLRLSEAVVEDNTGVDRYAAGGGIDLYNAGNGTSPMVIERSTIQNNTTEGQHGYGRYGGGGLRMHAGIVLVANCQIIDNKGDNYGSAFCKTGGHLWLFGCLIKGNAKRNGAAGTAIYSNTSPNIGTLRLVNCTVIQPDDEPSFPATNSNVPLYVTFINSILDLKKLNLPAYLQNGYDPGWTHAQMKANAIDIPAFRYVDGPKGAPVAHETNTLAGAVTMQDDTGRYRFHSLAADNTDANPSLALDIAGATVFAATDGEKAWQPQSGDPSVDSAATLAGSGFTYVDMDLDNSYTARRDIIVAGTPPSGDHFVYTTDLMGNNRLKADGLDRGCCEHQPPLGTVLFIR